MAEGIGNQDACTGNVEEKYGVRIERRPSQSRLSDLDIRSWPKWGCPPGKFLLKFEAEETFYLVKGKVRAYMKEPPDQYVDFGAGDLVVIPKGMNCTWDVSVAVDKHYKFEH